jgi:hypothetical protein
MSLNFNDDSFWELALNIRWPHEGIILGYELIPADDICDYVTIKVHLLFVTILIEYGNI